MIDELDSIKKYVRAANYLTAIQIYLQGNFFLKDALKSEHIKQLNKHCFLANMMNDSLFTVMLRMVQRPHRLICR
ncbi:MAG: hypothetical protein EXS46_00745 [Candidatus Taylorbacteria bacterium]|nr:hypothetical protein [Candidatus Taylorbacteria bacterium]